MDKQPNSDQDKLLVKFMVSHPDVAKGFVRGKKRRIESLWREVTNVLNKHGPPLKDASGWKKVWFNWNDNIRDKLVHNKVEGVATRGGPKNMLPISAMEETIAKLMGIYTIVNGIEGTSSYGLGEHLENMESVASPQPEPTSPQAPKPPPSKKQKLNKGLESHMSDQMTALENIADVCRQSLKAIQETTDNGHRMYRALESIHDLLSVKNDEEKRHHLAMEKLMAEANEYKRTRLQIEEIKLNQPRKY